MSQTSEQKTQPERKEQRSSKAADAGSPIKRERVKSSKGKGSKAASACIWKECRLSGEIHIGEKTVVGPGCSITSYGGPIHIGKENVLTECVQITNKSEKPMVIGDCNIFETGARIEARKIGSYNMFAAKSHLQPESVIGNGCVIGPKMQVIKKKQINDYTIMAANNLIQAQKTFKRRNVVYVQKLVKLLSHQYRKTNSKDMMKLSKGTRPRPTSRTHRSDGRATQPVSVRTDGKYAAGMKYRKDGGRSDLKAPRAGDRLAAKRMDARRDRGSPNLDSRRARTSPKKLNLPR